MQHTRPLCRWLENSVQRSEGRLAQPLVRDGAKPTTLQDQRWLGIAHITWCLGDDQGCQLTSTSQLWEEQEGTSILMNMLLTSGTIWERPVRKPKTNPQQKHDDRNGTMIDGLNAISFGAWQYCLSEGRLISGKEKNQRLMGGQTTWSGMSGHEWCPFIHLERWARSIMDPPS